MSFSINFRKEDEPKLRATLRLSHPGLMAESRYCADLPEVFEVDYNFDEADGSINAVSDDFQPDAEALYATLAEARIAAYGARSDEYGRTLYAVAGNQWAEVDSLNNSDYPAVRINPDGSIERVCIDEAVEYWALFKRAHKEITGRKWGEEG